MRTGSCATLALILGLSGCTPAAEPRAGSAKETAALWYKAFSTHDPALLDRILSDSWVDIPAPEGQPSGSAGAKQILAQLTTAFPDFTITIRDVVQEGNKVVVRADITGTQRGVFMGRPGTGQKLRIGAVDIHEVVGGKIVRTWHMEDWMTGLHQLGIVKP
jgi:steroid delta-isomerase-like uncharacterized protein